MAMDAKQITSSENTVCSVCIANYNGIDVIGEAVKSVYEQDCEFPVDIIIHDDASTDGSVEFIRENFPGVNLITSKRNVGFCISNNRMVAQARGGYILLLNNDAILFADAIRTLYNQVAREDSPSILGLPQYDASTGKLIDRGSLLDPFVNPVPNLNSKRSQVAMVIGACMWLPKSLWEELGGFLDFFGSLAEDMYLCCYARLRGYPVKVTSTSGFRHHVGCSLGGGKVIKNRLSTSKGRRAFSERNKSYVIVLAYPSPFFQLIFPLHIFLLLFEGILLAIIKKDVSLWHSIYLSCIKSLWKNRHNLCHSRKNIQNSRAISSLKFFSPFSLMPHKLSMLIKHRIPEIR